MNTKPKTLREIWLVITVLLLLLASARVGWIVFHQPPEHPAAENGVIDLSTWEFSGKETITLNGEWEFYPQVFLAPHEDRNNYEKTPITVPDGWQKQLGTDTKDSYGYGTYRLKLLLPEQETHSYGLRFQEITTAGAVYIDGVLVSTFGEPATTATEAKGKLGPFSALIHPDHAEIEILIHVSNFDVPKFGGITKPIKIGTDQAIMNESNRSISLQLVVGIIYLLHSFYAFIIYFIDKGRSQKAILFFGIMLVSHGVTIFIDDDIVICLPFDIQTHYRILLALFISTLLSLLVFVRHIIQMKSRYFQGFYYLYGIILVGLVLLPFESLFSLVFLVTLIYLSAFIVLYRQTISYVRRGNDDGMFIILFITSYLSNMVWGLAINARLVSFPYYPFDFIVTILFIAILLFKQHMRTVEINHEQTIRLQHADKVKDEFLANTSHEIRNPLHGIINIAQSIVDTEPSLSNNARNNLLLIVDIGKRMNFTLNDLTAVTQLKEGEVKLYKKKVNLHSVSILVINMLDFMKEGKDLELKSNIPPTFPEVVADENRLIQILFNLVHNAVKYTEKGTIEIDATYNKEYCTISVKDSGAGIIMDHPENIFRPYEQLQQEDTNLVTGIGIGLSVSKQLVELHGGTITYHSTPKGTTFIFTIPNDSDEISRLDGDQAVIASALESAATNQYELVSVVSENPLDSKDEHKPIVLIVDDDPVNLKILKQILIADYRVYTALSGAEALQKIEITRFDIIISDVMMPQMSGYKLTEAIREKYALSELPILLVTARGLPEDIEAAFRSGASDYLVKPVNALELKTRVQALTALKKSVRESLRIEAAWLQAQIHPHFLFNTLNSIASLAEIDTARMVNLLEAFGTYLEKSFAIKNIQSEIPLTDELKLTRSYVHIEKERFGDRLHVEFDLTNHLDVMIPPLSIQPLVENAIMHGVLAKREGGTIWVSIKKQDEFLHVVIKDDGVGMGEEKIAEILSLQYDPDDGVGVKNTNRRLIQLYGKGLKIDSTPGKGTTVTFRIPYQPRDKYKGD